MILSIKDRALLAFVPLVNLIGLLVFAFTRWPNLATTAARL
jgi:hypothetical protein